MFLRYQIPSFKESGTEGVAELIYKTVEVKGSNTSEAG